MKQEIVVSPYQSDLLHDGRVRLVTLPERTFAGLPVSCAFSGSVADRVEKAQHEFYQRVKELGEQTDVLVPIIWNEQESRKQKTHGDSEGRL